MLFEDPDAGAQGRFHFAQEPLVLSFQQSAIVPCGHSVIAIDRDVSGIADLAEHDLCEIIEADLEGREYLPFAGRWFAAIAVTNYLHRPLFPALIAAIEPGGVLIYETFARGNERFGHPRNPDFLLQPGELLETVRGKLDIVAFEEGLVTVPRQAVVQRICARKTPDAEAIGPGPLPPPLLPSADP